MSPHLVYEIDDNKPTKKNLHGEASRKESEKVS